LILDAYRKSEDWDAEVYDCIRDCIRDGVITRLDFRTIQDIVDDKRVAPHIGWDWRAKARERLAEGRTEEPRTLDDAEHIMLWSWRNNLTAFSSSDYVRASNRFRGGRKDAEQVERRRAAFAYCVARGWLRQVEPPIKLGKGRDKSDWYVVCEYSQYSQNGRGLLLHTET
jgi:hypothetical protein